MQLSLRVLGKWRFLITPCFFHKFPINPHFSNKIKSPAHGKIYEKCKNMTRSREKKTDIFCGEYRYSVLDHLRY